MGISTSQVFMALIIALIPGFFALQLLKALYKL
uniref:Photosystem I reaction center subunit XII n=1 Tax=Discoplastis spathirhyncha TaxID=215771 RepID=A0A3G3LLE4_9EUGL|nr:PSI M-polypeptide [Discoplastis spathirhyncha]AYQ93528.1 PSI M-polypeptide [Discoplastis spathirhyncha]